MNIRFPTNNIFYIVFTIIFIVSAIRALIALIVQRKQCRVCPKCGNKMILKKKYKISDKGYFMHRYVRGTIRTTKWVPYCKHCEYEIPSEDNDDDSWKDASEL